MTAKEVTITEGLRRELGDDGVLTLTLDRPEVHNALTWRTRDALAEELEQASADTFVRAVVVTGAGDRAFCAGADLRMPPRYRPGPVALPNACTATWHAAWLRAAARADRRIGLRQTGHRRCQRHRRRCGHASGVAADVVVMAESARLVPVFVRRAIVPDGGGAYLLTRLVARHVASSSTCSVTMCRRPSAAPRPGAARCTSGGDGPDGAGPGPAPGRRAHTEHSVRPSA